MKPTTHGPMARVALALGLVVGAWMLPSASTAGLETVSQGGAAAAAAEPDNIRLAQADTGPVDRPVSFTAEQADRGKKRYESECVDCHGDDLKGGLNGGAPLRGVSFDEKYGNGGPASSMFVFMSTLMPPNDPGRYSPSTYADLMAYILKRNGYPEGAPLPSDADALDYLIMEK
jgi:mono/diheme cytochrome c family protein